MMRNTRNSWTLFEWLIVLVMFVMVAAIVTCVIDAATSTPQAIKHCVVSEKHYEAAHTTTDNDGNATFHPDEWFIIATPIFEKIIVTDEQFDKLSVGRRVDILVRKGGLVGGSFYQIAPSLEAQ